MEQDKPTFVVDDMVGKLAKWLRILGYDTLYFKKIENKRLIDIALRQERILLTRDTEMVRDKRVKKHILIEDDHYSGQLRQVLDTLGLSVRAEKVFSRCLICNEELKVVAKDFVKGKVPEFVFKTQEKFTACPRCDRIYWNATHLRHVEEMLEKLA